MLLPTIIRHARSQTSASWRSSPWRAFSIASDPSLVDFSVDDKNPHIGHLTLCSPHNYNALTVESGKSFAKVVQHIIHDVLTEQDIRAIILTGQGKAFSAGGNLDWLRSLHHNATHANADAMMAFYNDFLCIRQVPVPVIAAIQGPAMGAGAGLALACDLRVMDARYGKLGLHFTQLGIHTGMGASHFLQKAVQSSAALNEILLNGKILSAQECRECGLLNRLCSQANTDDDNENGIETSKTTAEASYELATELTQRHPVALRLLVQTLRAQQDEGLVLALQREALAQALCYSRQDWGEGVNAIAEKRQPHFDGYHDK